MIDFVASVESESRRFLEAVRTLDPAGRVPSCPDWSVGDLIWHLTQVQLFWAQAVEDLAVEPRRPDLERPDHAQLVELYAATSRRLVDGLASTADDQPCWSWHADGGTVAWVKRRQAHEALIHRADAELAASQDPVLDEVLAADGIDEVLDVMIGGVPEWGTFTPTGEVVGLRSATHASLVKFGQFTGTSPNSGTTYEEEAAQRSTPTEPTAWIEGSASDLDLWLWGRAPLERLAVKGDRDLAIRLRAVASVDTQ